MFFAKLIAWLRPQVHLDPFDFCQDIPQVYATLAHKLRHQELDTYIQAHLPMVLDALIYDDRFTREQLDKLRDLIASFKQQIQGLDALVAKALLKFTIRDALEKHSGMPFKYEGALSFELDDDETPIWQWHDVTILASHKPMVLGVDVLTDCGCVTKVSDQLLTRKKSEDFLAPEALSFAKIHGNDILITDKHLYIKSDKAYDKVRHDALITKHIDSKGFVISTLALRGRVLIFRIKDPNFMNLLMNQY